ncbi:glycosyltransferase [bacterium]|nr:glycosyltransferase [bacterium]
MASKPFRILYVIERLARAGTELHMLQVIRRLNRDRFEPLLCCLSESTSDVSLLPRNVPCRFLKGGWNLSGPRMIPLYLALRHTIREVQPDVVHSFLFVANVLSPFASHSAKGIVASRGRMGIEWEAGGLHRLAQTAASRRTNAIVCKTHAMRDEIIRVEGVPAGRVHVHPNGVDVERYRVEPSEKKRFRQSLLRTYGIPAKGALILAVGNLKPIKDQITLVKAAAGLRDIEPTPFIAIVGEGESRRDLETAIRSENLEQHVRLIGRQENMRPWMAAADLYVASSVSEGLPNALLEAMASSLPPVLSQIPGHEEAAGENAWYFPAGNPEALAKGLREALASPQARAERAEKGLERVQTHFSIDRMMVRLEELYLNLLEKRSRS